MIKAEHSNIARLIFDPYINRLLRKSFTNFYLLNDLPQLPEEKSLVVTPNHISWWDGFFIDFVSKKLIHRKLHIMMLESSLKKYWFFKKLGAYSIEPESSRSVLETTKYTRMILSNPDNFVVTYPQGEIEPFEKRPVNIREGLKLFVNANPENKLILPVGFKIQFFDKKKPAVICRFGETIEAEKVVDNFKIFAKSFADNLDHLNQAVFRKEFKSDLFK